MYFMVTLNSDVLVGSVELLTMIVTVQGAASPVVIFSNGTEVDSSLDFQYYESYQNQVAFQINALYGPQAREFVLFDSLSGQDLFTFMLEAEMAVTYQTTFGRKRDIESKTVSFSSRAVVDASNMKENTPAVHAKKASAVVPNAKMSAGPAVSIGSVLLIAGAVVALVAVVVVVVVVHRRRALRS